MCGTVTFIALLPDLILSGTVFPGPILSGTVLPGPVLSGTVLPGLVLPGLIIPERAASRKVQEAEGHRKQKGTGSRPLPGHRGMHFECIVNRNLSNSD